jgi:hypothetical protein
MPIPSILWDRFWVWHPYDGAKISRFRSLYGLCFVPAGMKTMIGYLMNLLWTKPVKAEACIPLRCDQ